MDALEFLHSWQWSLNLMEDIVAVVLAASIQLVPSLLLNLPQGLHFAEQKLGGGFLLSVWIRVSLLGSKIAIFGSFKVHLFSCLFLRVLIFGCELAEFDAFIQLWFGFLVNVIGRDLEIILAIFGNC